MEHPLYTVVRMPSAESSGSPSHPWWPSTSKRLTASISSDGWPSFAHDALVNVELQAYWEKPASSECAKRDIIGGRLTMNVSHSDQPLGNLIMAARVGGDCEE